VGSEEASLAEIFRDYVHDGRTHDDGKPASGREPQQQEVVV